MFFYFLTVSATVEFHADPDCGALALRDRADLAIAEIHPDRLGNLNLCSDCAAQEVDAHATKSR